jgi:putative flippase GtrA
VVVGVIGVGVTNGILAALHELGHVAVVLAGAVGSEGAVVTTFVLNNAVTWKDRHHRSLLRRAGRYQLVTLGGLACYLASIWLLATVVGVHYLLAATASSAVAAVWNYTGNHLITFGRRRRRAHLLASAPLTAEQTAA